MTIRNIMLMISLLTGSISISMAQSELGSYFLNDLGAAQYLNPAKIQHASFSWALPSAYYVHGTRGPSLYSMLRKRVIDFSNVKGSLKEENSFMYSLQGSLGSLHFRYRDFGFHIGHNTRLYNQFDYSERLFDMLLNGNAQYIGETVQLGPYTRLDFYNEFYLGAAVKVRDMQIGTRIKLLNGYLNALTPKNEFSIYTHDEIYQLRFQTAYEINTNLYADSLALDSYGSIMLKNLWSNTGWAIDFGITADIYDRFTISASILDMGVIHWDNNAGRIITEGSYEFEGFDIAALITDSLNIIDLDSLSKILDVHILEEDYRSSLNAKFYLGLQYYLNEKWEINGLFYNAYGGGQSFPSVSLMGKFKPSESFHTALSYSWNPFAAFNLGWNIETHLKWFHWYLNMDNIIDMFNPIAGNYFNIRTGIQIDLVR